MINRVVRDHLLLSVGNHENAGKRIRDAVGTWDRHPQAVSAGERRQNVTSKG
jgi:hypothetical protein